MYQPELSQCLANPGICFKHPKDVLETPQFSNDEKRQILKQWELDVIERLVAEEENMPDLAQGGANMGALLMEIHQALEQL